MNHNEKELTTEDTNVHKGNACVSYLVHSFVFFVVNLARSVKEPPWVRLTRFASGQYTLLPRASADFLLPRENLCRSVPV
jgi:hypothetical protein